jgi:catechol 2,3-dioxygenase-like lactoylglutathione lyase family enzyme
MGMHYTHTSINSPDWERLVRFYVDVFDCVPVPPLRHLRGAWFEKVTGIPGAEVRGAHIALPGYGPGGPTLEIFTYTHPASHRATPLNGQGYSHIAIRVDDVEAVYRKLLDHGGSADGEIVRQYYDSMHRTLTMIYAKDPDGNIVEIQHWAEGKP